MFQFYYVYNNYIYNKIGSIWKRIFCLTFLLSRKSFYRLLPRRASPITSLLPSLSRSTILIQQVLYKLQLSCYWRMISWHSSMMAIASTTSFSLSGWLRCINFVIFVGRSMSSKCVICREKQENAFWKSRWVDISW